MTRLNSHPTSGDGLTTPHSQPAKTITKHTIDFIARAASYATADSGYLVLFVVVLVQAVLMALAGVLQ
jgi:hypothetical protein